MTKMNYSFQVSYLNTLRQKKIIPYNVLEEIQSNKSLSSIVSLLKEYKYNRIFSFSNPEKEIYNATNFELVLETEIKETLDLLSGLLLDKHKFLILWFKYFYSNNFENLDSIIIFFKNHFVLFKKLNSVFCEKLLQLTIDFENIKLFLYYTEVHTQFTQEIKFIPEGNIKEYSLKDCFPSIENLNKYIINTFYQKIKLSTQPQKENLNYYFNEYLKDFIWESKFYYFTIEPIITYFFEKLIETQKLKEIYYNIKLKK